MSICSSVGLGLVLTASACAPAVDGADAVASPALRIELPPVAQPAASESIWCLHVWIADELRAIARIESTAHPIVHDLSVTLVPASLAPDGSFGEECDVGAAAVMIYETRSSSDEAALPPGTALYPGGDTALRVRAHYLNVTDRTITAEVAVSIEAPAGEGDVVPLGAVYALDGEVPAPPGMGSAIVDCDPGDGGLALLSGTGGGLVAGITISDETQELFATRDRDHPGATRWPQLYDPAGALRARCELVNPTGVATNERCGVGALVSGASGLVACGP